MANPFVTAACDHLVKTFQPAQAATSVQFDKGRIYDFADRRIPANPHISGNGFQDVHATRGDDRNLHCAGINIDDADAFLPSAVQSAHADRERLGGL